MFQPLDNWDDLKTFSEIFKNLFEALAVLGGVGVLWKYLVERKDRATDILLRLEKEFCKKKVMQGRQCIEDDGRYHLIKDRLKQYVAESRRERSMPAGESSEAGQKFESPKEKNILDECQAIDALLRFYVVLCGIRQAKQVPERSLSTCFRFWLGHYRSPKRTEFREYVDVYFPTLKKWLTDDAKKGHTFFCPGHFGWPET